MGTFPKVPPLFRKLICIELFYARLAKIER